MNRPGSARSELSASFIAVVHGHEDADRLLASHILRLRMHAI